MVAGGFVYVAIIGGDLHLSIRQPGIGEIRDEHLRDEIVGR